MGSGGVSSPYLISSLDNLLWLSTNPEYWETDTYFRQTADIDASATQNWNQGEGFNPIGWRIYFDYYQAFQGNYDGDGHTITGLYIHRPSENSIGLFGYTFQATISDLYVTYASVTAYDYTGSIVGYAKESMLEYCSCSGIVSGNDMIGGLAGFVENSLYTGLTSGADVSGVDYIGGLVGRVQNSVFSSSSSGGSVNGTNYVGGCFGYVEEYSSVSSCNSTSEVNGIDYVGGFIGEIREHSSISDSFTNGTTVVGEHYVGGFAGSMKINGQVRDSYSERNVDAIGKCGGLIGDIEGVENIENSFFPYELISISSVPCNRSGALRTELYDTWKDNNQYLSPLNYFASQDNDYQISNADEFLLLQYFGQRSNYSFILTDNIDLHDYEDEVIPIFKGTLNGMEYAITNYNIDSSYDSSGLFEIVKGAVVKDVSIINANVQGNSDSGLLGGIVIDSEISFCECSGTLEGTSNIGGLVGNIYNSTILCCSSFVTINGVDSVGGLVGLVNARSIVENSYTKGIVTGNDAVGGVVGSMIYNSYLNNVYSLATVQGSTDVGGLAGSARNSAIFDNVWNNQIVASPIGSYYSTIVSHVVESDSLSMRDVNTYLDIDWDFIGEIDNGEDDYWGISPVVNDGFPIIQDVTTSLEIEEVVSIEPTIIVYPNPFNSYTEINIKSSSDKNSLICIYNIRGQKIKELAINDGFAKWDGTDQYNKKLASGIYLVKSMNKGYTASKKIMFVK